MMKITFNGKKRQVANFNGFEVITDLAKDAGGEGTALNPFELFLTSLGSCGALFMRIYFENHSLSLEGCSFEQDFEFDEKGNLQKVLITLNVGKDFDPQHKEGLLAMLRSCKVKKHVSEKIEFVYTVVQ